MWRCVCACVLCFVSFATLWNFPFKYIAEAGTAHEKSNVPRPRALAPSRSRPRSPSPPHPPKKTTDTRKGKRERERERKRNALISF